jgi:hypothetical protein
LETVADFGEFPGRQVDPLLLYFRALLLDDSERLLSVGTLRQRLQVGRHLLHGVGEFGQLSGDSRYVIGGCDSAAILRVLSGGSRRVTPSTCSTVPANLADEPVLSGPASRRARRLGREILANLDDLVVANEHVRGAFADRNPTSRVATLLVQELIKLLV